MYQRKEFILKQREEILKKMYGLIRANRHIIGAAVGSGMSARCASDGGADFILVLNSGKFRQMGRSSLGGLLPFSNCNTMTMDLAEREILPLVKDVPIFIGLGATDPYINIEDYLDELIRLGISGVINYPTVGLIDGRFREAVEEDGACYDLEVEAIRMANSKNLFTVAFVFDRDQALKMACAKADVICIHLGFSAGGAMGVKESISLQEAVDTVKDISAAINAVKSDTIIMIYGGPVRISVDAKYLYDSTGISGYIGGSSFDSMPSEQAVMERIREFKNVGISTGDPLLEKMLDSFSKHFNYVEFVKKHIHSNYMHPISFSSVAAEAHVSRTHLSSVFKKSTGCTFPEYLLNIRINKALEIMKNGQMDLSQIALAVGYQDYACFSKSFKKKMGICPKDYLQNTLSHGYHTK
jgi:predicted TIM-barrel enzyme/AraC-like DNA-binding protein